MPCLRSGLDEDNWSGAEADMTVKLGGYAVSDALIAIGLALANNVSPLLV